MLHIKETVLSFGRLGLWLVCAFTFYVRLKITMNDIMNDSVIHFWSKLFYFASDPCQPYLGEKMDRQLIVIQNFLLINTRRDSLYVIQAKLMRAIMNVMWPVPRALNREQAKRIWQFLVSRFFCVTFLALLSTLCCHCAYMFSNSSSNNLKTKYLQRWKGILKVEREIHVGRIRG